MFALRGIAVSLTFFVLLYSLLSAIVAIAWRPLKWVNTTERKRADLLFALRVLPLVSAAAITLGFVIPSFQLLEPRSIDEGLGTIPLALGICALLLIAYGCFRVITAQVTTSRVIAHWLQGTRPLHSSEQAVALQSRESPPLTLVGVRHPKVLISESAVALLSSDELDIALKHERAHMLSCDNLKKLLFRFCPFPGMAKLESAWSQTAELAADDAAVSKLENAVDLAAALVKLSRLATIETAAVCTVGFVTGSVSARVARLLAWDEAAKKQPIGNWQRYAILPMSTVLFCVIVTYHPALALTHELTEWLVR